MTIEPKLMIAIPIESDIKTFANWLLNYYERIPVNIANEGELIEGIFVDSYFQHLRGGNSGLYHFRLFTEITGLKPSDLFKYTTMSAISLGVRIFSYPSGINETFE